MITAEVIAHEVMIEWCGPIAGYRCRDRDGIGAVPQVCLRNLRAINTAVVEAPPKPVPTQTPQRCDKRELAHAIEQARLLSWFFRAPTLPGSRVISSMDEYQMSYSLVRSTSPLG
jgi:hypothetical protein